VRAVPRRLGLAAALAPDAELWAVLLAAVPPLAIGLSLILAPVSPDYWWHVTTGRWMLEHHRVPFTDPFSWTHGGQNWIAHEWLAELLLALADRAGGYAAAIVVTGVIACAGFWLLVDAARSYGVSRRTAALLMLLFGGISLSGVTVRPQVWGWALLCVLLARLAAYETGHARRLWLLPPLFVLWINLHLTAFIGLGCLGIFAFGRLVRRRPDRHLLLVCLLCGAALLINPRGPELVRFALLYGDPHALRYDFINEWRRPRIDDLVLLPFWLSAFMAPVAVWIMVRRRALWPAAVVLSLFAVSLRAQRYAPVYGLLLIPFAGWIIWNRGSRTGHVSPSPGTAAWRLLPSGRPLAVAFAAVGLVLAGSTLFDVSQFRREPAPRGYPAEATTALIEHARGARLFNTYSWGGYLIYRLWPDTKVYVDGREEMYGDDFLRHYIDVEAGGAGALAYLRREGITAALLEGNGGIAALLAADPAWSIAYQGKMGILFLRNASATADQ
jgi:hypothetical protein